LQVVALGHCHAPGTEFSPQPPFAFAEVFLQIDQPLLPVIEPCLRFDQALKRAVLHLALSVQQGLQLLAPPCLTCHSRPLLAFVDVPVMPSPQVLVIAKHHAPRFELRLDAADRGAKGLLELGPPPLPAGHQFDVSIKRSVYDMIHN
jgi:hypothetical protein